MNTWRDKAFEFFPDLQDIMQDEESTIYTIWFELLPRCREAHREGNVEELKKIYGYAEWCHRHKDKEVCNAVGVAFYEHLCDDSQMCNELPSWVKDDIFNDITGLLEWRIGKDAVV